VRLGIITPIVIVLPRSHNAWEVDATVEDLVTIARAADRLGYHHLTASEHVAVPVDVEGRRGKRYWDLLATLSYLAAVTDRIRLATNVVVLPYHHPLEVVKHYGTLDRLSGGRVVLGVGVGTLEEEFALLGKTLAGRGDRADDAIRAIRAAWGVREPIYRGVHYEFGDVVVDPTAVRAQVPIWVGGRTPRSLRRAIELGDAWTPFLLAPYAVRAMLERAADTPAWVERGRPLDVVLWPEPAVDPEREPDRVLEQAHEHVRAGATILNWRFPSRSVAHHVELMEALVRLLDPDWSAPAP
jgi:probable F420-dependent oxidoreductase